MRKVVGLIVNTKGHTCEIVYSNASFEELKCNFNICEKHFISTNWNGCDSIERTCKVENLKITGRKFPIKISISGIDQDMWNSYKWYFQANEFWEVLKNT